MKVLSIRQPWASLIIYGYKKYEFRTWNTKFRGEFLIHASKGIEKENLKTFASLNIPFPTGVIMGKATLDDVIPVTKDFEDNLIKENKLLYGASKGRGGYAFKLTNIQKLDNEIPINGKLGFWKFDKEWEEIK